MTVWYFFCGRWREKIQNFKKKMILLHLIHWKGWNKNKFCSLLSIPDCFISKFDVILGPEVDEVLQEIEILYKLFR